MATFPSSVISFGSDVVDGVDDVMASHINTPRAEIVAIETYLRSTRFDQNLLADSLTHDASWLAGTALNDVSDDNYGPSLWNILNDAGVGAAPDIAGVAGGTIDPFTRYCQITLDATAQIGMVQFLTAQQTRPLRGGKVSLSLDMWATGITTMRFAVLAWTGTADSLTSDVVGTWDTTPTLATNWAYAQASSGQVVSSSRARYTLQNVSVPADANNLAVFIWTPVQEASADVLNIARVKLEPGAAATDFVARSPDEELARINYFYQVLDASSNTINIGLGTKTSSATIAVTVQTRKMRVAPTVSHNITAYTAGTPGTTTIALLNRITSAFYAITGALTFASIANNKDYITLQATAGTSWDGTIGDLASLRIGPSVLIAADARL
jgi:hypothetical protein